MDTNHQVQGDLATGSEYSASHKPSQLDWKQSHIWLNQYEYDTLKCAPVGDPWNSVVHHTGLDFLRYLEDPEHD